jgi:hypothetical protein
MGKPRHVRAQQDLPALFEEAYRLLLKIQDGSVEPK